jgi:hypothetical protein
LINAKNEFICDYPKDCGKPATRVVRYFADGPRNISLDRKGNVFCDKHAKVEMIAVQKPGAFYLDDEPCIVRELENVSIEDCCCQESNAVGEVMVRVGKNVDPGLWGFAPKRRGTTFVLETVDDEVDSQIETRRIPGKERI